jgi:beta-glucosidase
LGNVQFITICTIPDDQPINAFWSHYIDVEKTPLYPFGYGLSYTSFEYKNLKLAKATFQKGEKIELSVDVTNTGNVDGKEVVQLYINDVAASVVRPVKELKGFELIALKKGETKTVHFTLTDKELGFYDNNGKFLTESGLFNVLVGWNSNEGLTTKFELK